MPHQAARRGFVLLQLLLQRGEMSLSLRTHEVPKPGRGTWGFAAPDTTWHHSDTSRNMLTSPILSWKDPEVSNAGGIPVLLCFSDVCFWRAGNGCAEVRRCPHKTPLNPAGCFPSQCYFFLFCIRGKQISRQMCWV